MAREEGYYWVKDPISGWAVMEYYGRELWYQFGAVTGDPWELPSNYEIDERRIVRAALSENLAKEQNA